MIGLLKDIYSDVSHFLLTYFSPRIKNKKIDDLSRYGCCVGESLLSRESCKKLKLEVDRLMNSDGVNVWQDSLKSDSRIYGIETLSKLFFELIDVDTLKSIGEIYLGKKITHYFILAGKLREVGGNTGSGGGWHRDSAFSHQFKTIIYLTDVSTENGPFEYVQGTHTTFNKLLNVSNISLKDTRLDELKISKLNKEPLEILGKKGTMLFADTRGIHRGKPIEKGERYALTFYFWTSEPPEHMKKNLQGQVSTL